MSTVDHTSSLHNIGDENLTTADPAEDVRGRKVLDKAGADIGDVDDLVIDDREHKVRFLRVAAGWIPGAWRDEVLNPGRRHHAGGRQGGACGPNACPRRTWTALRPKAHG